MLLALLAALSATLAAPDLDKTLSLAQQRYGTSGVQTVLAWRKMMDEARGLPELDKLEKVNTFFNRSIMFQDDAIVWRQEDYWATPLEFMGRGAGDCEDFSIAKYITLQLLGIANERLRMIYVRAKIGSTTSVAHMVLGYYAKPNGEPLILDNLISSVRAASTRIDLSPVFSFNNAGLWVGAADGSSGDPTIRLSRWRDVLERMRQDGF
ncbi:MAG: transglutaminase-like cysteine peptidase [Burkholderiaceae bacterium]